MSGPAPSNDPATAPGFDKGKGKATDPTNEMSMDEDSESESEPEPVSVLNRASCTRFFGINSNLPN